MDLMQPEQLELKTAITFPTIIIRSDTIYGTADLLNQTPYTRLYIPSLVLVHQHSYT